MSSTGLTSTYFFLCTDDLLCFAKMSHTAHMGSVTQLNVRTKPNASQHLEFPRNSNKLRNSHAFDRLPVKTSCKPNIPSSGKTETLVVSSFFLSFLSSLSLSDKVLDMQPTSPVEGLICYHALNDVRFAWKCSFKNDDVILMPEDCTDFFL